MLAQGLENFIPELRSSRSGADRFTATSISMPSRRHVGHLPDGGPQRPAGQAARAAGLLGDGYELTRGDHTQLRMGPARQCLEAAHAAVDQVHLGLVHQREFIAFDAAAQIAGQREPAPQILLAPGAVAGDAATRLTGVLQRGVHMAQQILGGIAVIRRAAHAGIHMQIEADREQAEAGAQRSDELLGQQVRAAQRTAARQHQELRGAEAGGDVVLAAVLAQSSRRLTQGLVAYVMAQRGVDLAKIGHLEQDQRHGRDGAARSSSSRCLSA